MNRLVLALLIPMIAAKTSVGETDTRVFPSTGILAINIETEAGSIAVVGLAKGDAQVQFLDVLRDRCRVTADITNGTLTASAVRPVQSSRVNCTARIRILAPAMADINALAGAGDIDISSVSGNVKTRTGSGKTSLHLLKGSLTSETGEGSITGAISSQEVSLQVGSGSIDLSGLLGSAHALIGNGNLRLKWQSLPTSARVSVQAGHGDSELWFPPGSKVHVRHNPQNRPIRNDFSEADGTSVFIQNAIGDIAIHKTSE